MKRFVVSFGLFALLLQLGCFVIFQFVLPGGLLKSHFRRMWTFATLQLLMLIGTGFIWTLLVRPVTRSNANGFIIEAYRAIAILFLLGSHASFSAYYFLVGTEPHWFSTFSFTCLSLYINLSAFLIADYIGGWFIEKLDLTSLGSVLLHPFKRFPVTRWLLFNKCVHTTFAVVLAFGLTAHGLYRAAQPPTIRHITVRLNNLPSEFDRFKIALLSDVHVGPVVGRTMVQQAVALTNALQPDVVAICGDLVDGSVEKLRYATQPLKHLRSKYGTFFTTGNHEYYHGDVNKWFEELAGIGVTVLHNSNHKIQKDKSGPYLCLAGTDDVTAESSSVPGHGMNLTSALNHCDIKYPRILMSHQPKGAKRALASGIKLDLILAGHTHGGQFLVLVPLAYFVNYPFFQGHYTHQSGTQIYVTEGVYFYGPPSKRTCEIALIELRSHS